MVVYVVGCVFGEFSFWLDVVFVCLFGSGVLDDVCVDLVECWVGLFVLGGFYKYLILRLILLFVWWLVLSGSLWFGY